MYEYYLKCTFRNAKLFRKFPKERTEYKKTSHERVLSKDGKTYKLEDKLFDSYIEPITYLQMTNVLYALCGKPLVSTRHKTYNRHIPEFLSWAKDCYIKYDNEIFLNDDELPGGKKEYKGLVYNGRKVKKDFIVTNKSKDNSNVKTSLSTMGVVNRYIRNRDFGYTFEEFITAMCKNYKLKSIGGVDDMISKIFQQDPSYLFNFMGDKVGIVALKTMFIGVAIRLGFLPESTTEPIEFDSYTIEPYKNVNEYQIRSVTDEFISDRLNNGISKAEYFDGEIMIPMTSEQLEMINKGSLASSILDGGMLIPQAVLPYERTRLRNFTKFSDISLEKIIL